MRVSRGSRFGPPYRLLAQWKAQRNDRPGAIALLDQRWAGQSLFAAGARPRGVGKRRECATICGTAARLGASRKLIRAIPPCGAGWGGRDGAQDYNRRWRQTRKWSSSSPRM